MLSKAHFYDDVCHSCRASTSLLAIVGDEMENALQLSFKAQSRIMVVFIHVEDLLLHVA